MFGFDGDIPALGAIEEAPKKLAPLSPEIAKALEGSYKQSHSKIPSADDIFIADYINDRAFGAYELKVNKNRGNPCGEVVAEPKETKVTYEDYNKLLKCGNPFDGILFEQTGFLIFPNGQHVHYRDSIDMGFPNPWPNGSVFFQGKGSAIKTYVSKDGDWTEVTKSKVTNIFNSMGPDNEDLVYSQSDWDDMIEDLKEEIYDDARRDGYDEGHEDGYDEGLEEAKDNLSYDDLMEKVSEMLDDGDTIGFINIDVQNFTERTSRVIPTLEYNAPNFVFVDSHHPSNRENEFEGDFEFERDRVITKDGEVWYWDVMEEEWKTLKEQKSDSAAVGTNAMKFGPITVEPGSDSYATVITEDGQKFHFINDTYASEAINIVSELDTDTDIVVCSDGDVAKFNNSEDMWVYLMEVM